jgi:hypothetical protein
MAEIMVEKTEYRPPSIGDTVIVYIEGADRELSEPGVVIGLESELVEVQLKGWRGMFEYSDFSPYPEFNHVWRIRDLIGLPRNWQMQVSIHDGRYAELFARHVNKASAASLLKNVFADLFKKAATNERERKEKRIQYSWFDVAAFFLLAGGLIVTSNVLHNLSKFSVSWAELGQRGDFWNGHLSNFIGVASFLLLWGTLRLQIVQNAKSDKQFLEQLKVLANQNTEIDRRNKEDFFLNFLETLQRSEKVLSTHGGSHTGWTAVVESHKFVMNSGSLATANPIIFMKKQAGPVFWAALIRYMGGVNFAHTLLNNLKAEDSLKCQSALKLYLPATFFEDLLAWKLLEHPDFSGLAALKEIVK